MFGYTLCLIFLVFLYTSCDQEELRQKAIQDSISEKVNNFAKKRSVDCEQKALEKAVILADSTLLLNADLWQLPYNLGDRPPIPIKPVGPTADFKVDSSKVQPIFPLHLNKK